MHTLSEQTQAIERWYQERARPFLEKVQIQPERVTALDRDLAKLVEVETLLPTELTVCFLGNSGVGKSTLINAIVGGATTLLPSGGIGPLTAQALTVRHGTEAGFEVQYHPFRNLWRLIFSLEQTHKAELARIDPTREYPVLDEDPTGNTEEAAEPLDTEPEEGDASAKRVAYRKLAQLLVTGGQDNHAELTYLIDCLREAVGKDRVFSTTTRDGDRARIDAIRAAIELAKVGQTKIRRGAPQDRPFLLELRNHASGFLAPLVKDLTVYWNSPLLASGVTLVDLPGVGISEDVYRDVTRKWVRERAEAVVVVVDHRGITEAVADLLRKSEFLNRLLYSAEDPTCDPVLMVAIAKIDDIADTRYAEDDTRPRRDHFADVCAESIPTIREQVGRQLEAVWSSSQGLGDAQRRVVDNILGTLQVHPLSAVQYRRALANKEDDRPFLADPASSHVPRFQEGLAELSRKRKAERRERLRGLRDVFLDRLLSILRVTQAQWEEETRASEEADRLREELKVFMEPLRKDLYVRQGQYRAFLKKTVPQRITDLVAAATAKAQVEIHKYLLRIGHTHWATLRASVRRGGRYAGATDIDIPREFALRVEEPIAEAWGKEILKDVRRETKHYAADCVGLVEKVVGWAREQGARVKPKLVEAQHAAVKADAAKLESVGREMVNDLREDVKNQLIEAIDAPIREGCQRFVKRNADVGPGVKARILELFSELAEEVPKTAVKPASTILTRLFGDVEKEISAAFESHQDPLTAAAEAIVSSQEDYLKRSDAQKRRKVLEEVRSVLAACPAASGPGSGAAMEASA